MIPVVSCLVMVVVVLWSLTKSVQYNEPAWTLWPHNVHGTPLLFHSNPRYRYGLWSLNVTVIMLATVVLCATRGGTFR